MIGSIATRRQIKDRIVMHRSRYENAYIFLVFIVFLSVCQPFLPLARILLLVVLFIVIEDSTVSDFFGHWLGLCWGG